MKTQTTILDRIKNGAKFDELLTDELFALEKEIIRWIVKNGRGVEGWRIVRVLIEERLSEERRMGYFDF